MFVHSAYIRWSNDNRDLVRAQLGNLPLTEMSWELGRRWALVDEETKEEYKRRAREEMAEYTLAMKSFRKLVVKYEKPKQNYRYRARFKTSKKKCTVHLQNKGC